MNKLRYACCSCVYMTTINKDLLCLDYYSASGSKVLTPNPGLIDSNSCYILVLILKNLTWLVTTSLGTAASAPFRTKKITPAPIWFLFKMGNFCRYDFCTSRSAHL